MVCPGQLLFVAVIRGLYRFRSSARKQLPAGIQAARVRFRLSNATPQASDISERAKPPFRPGIQPMEGARRP